MTTTSNDPTDGVHALERLLAVCFDGVEGYRRALVGVRAPHLHALLQRNVVEREEIASVLINALVELGAKHDHHGSLTGSVHRGLLGVLGVTHAEDAIMSECRRGDEVTLAAFAEALSHALRTDIRARIEAQRDRVLGALERLAVSEGTPAAPRGSRLDA